LTTTYFLGFLVVLVLLIGRAAVGILPDLPVTYLVKPPLLVPLILSLLEVLVSSLDAPGLGTLGKPLGGGRISPGGGGTNVFFDSEEPDAGGEISPVALAYPNTSIPEIDR